MLSFVASYEDRAKVRAAAVKAGWNPDASDCGPNDYVEADLHRTSRSFARKDEAIAWLQSEIASEKTYWGCGDVLEFANVPRVERCQACTCAGKRLDRRMTIDDEGVAEDEACDPCYFEE